MISPYRSLYDSEKPLRVTLAVLQGSRSPVRLEDAAWTEDDYGYRAWGFMVYLDPKEPTLFKDLSEEVIIRNPTKRGSRGSR